MSEDFLYSKSNYLHPKHAAQQHSFVTDYRDPNLSATTQYVPTIKQTGYIIGDPIPYTNNQHIIPTNLSNPTPKNHPNVKFDFQSPVNDRTRSVSRVVHIESPKNSRINIVKTVPAPPPPIHTTTHHYQQQMVPRKHYQKCISECQIWQSKFNELYNEYANKPVASSSSNQENLELKKQNMELRARVNELESRQRRVYEDLQRNFIKLVNKYKQSTLKECILLTDRYKLEKKHLQKY